MEVSVATRADAPPVILAIREFVEMLAAIACISACLCIDCALRANLSRDVGWAEPDLGTDGNRCSKLWWFCSTLPRL